MQVKYVGCNDSIPPVIPAGSILRFLFGFLVEAEATL